MRLLVGSSPHIRHEETVSIMMGDMLFALAPMAVMSYIYYGFRALLLILISVVSSIAFEYVYTRLYGRRSTVGDLSAAVTGAVLACCLPATAPLWFPVLGAFVAVIVVKQLFGGLGKNIFNPALTAVVFLTVTWPGILSSFPKPYRGLALFGANSGYSTDATALASLKNGLLPSVSPAEMLWGDHAGALGTGAVVVLLIAALYLLYRRLINWQVPAAFLGTVAVFALLLPRCPLAAGRFTSVFYELTGGSLLFIAFFMATDPATSPVSSFGRLLYGVLCGAFTVLFRTLGIYPEGAFFALLLMNPLSAPLDKIAWRLKVKGGTLLHARE